MADADEKTSITSKTISISHYTWRITKIISGGQTGADQAALDVAIQKGIPHGGWIPKGRLTEAGILPGKYQLKEMETASYPKRTEQNVIDSDTTLIVSHGKLTGEGLRIPGRWPEKHGKPWIHIDADAISQSGVEIHREGKPVSNKITGTDLVYLHRRPKHFTG